MTKQKPIDHTQQIADLRGLLLAMWDEVSERLEAIEKRIRLPYFPVYVRDAMVKARAVRANIRARPGFTAPQPPTQQRRAQRPSRARSRRPKAD